MFSQKRTRMGVNQTVKKEMMFSLREVVRRNCREGKSNLKWN